MQSLLGKLSELNVKLEVRDGKLHVNAPAGVLTAELQQAISQQKKSLIEILESAHAAPLQSQLPQITPDPTKRYEAFPLTDVQHAYWVGRSAQIELGAVSTHIYFELECGAVDHARLTASFKKVLLLHDMLRAVTDANGRQRVLEAIPDYDIELLDLRGMDPERRDNELQRVRSEMSHQVFASDRWPLFDLRLARIADEHSHLFVSWDFLMVDGWSLMLIFRQWFGYYQDPEYTVSSPKLLFRDYVLAETKLKEQPAYQVSKKYWWDRLDKLPSAPQLPIASNVDRGRKHAFTRRRFLLPQEQWEVVKTRARRSGITPTAVLLTAFSEVLNLWSKTPHYCLNLTLFSRLPLHDEVMAIVGDFTSLMALEIDARDHRSFAEQGARVQAQFLQDYDHRQVNALEVLRELAKRRGGQQASLPVVFTSTLMLDGKRSDDASVLEKFGPMGYGISQTPQVWLDYQIFEVNGDLVINWDAIEEVFLPGVLDDMFESHSDLLHLLARDPDAWLRKDIAELPRAQRQKRDLVNHTEAEVVDSCLHELFVEKAMESPDRVAVAWRDGAMRYGQLLAHANFVAEQLLQKGLTPKELVAIVMRKGWEQVVAALGVLIAGGAYLPIEPSWPELRRNHILERSDVRIALTQPELNQELAWPPNVHRLDVTEETALDLLATAPRIRQSPEDLAYVIFTSGSTGTPKGVMISHGGAVNTIVHVNRLFHIGEADSVLAVSDLTFDLSVYDLFGILAVGGAIVIPDAALSRDASHWEDLIRRYGVTVWNSAPPLMGMLVDELESGAARHLSSLRVVMLSGDWIAVALPDRIRRMSPGARVISLGGATEGSIWSIYYPVEEVSPDWDSIPYGRALPNQQMYVLNNAFRPCPDLVTGDIYIGGLGVAQGYWKDPEKTAQQFLVHSTSGERLYYTGDLGRIRQDGNIEFLGRADSQVKLRGHRVELGEITACLQSHPDIRDAAVRVLKQENRTILAAYVVANETAVSLFEKTEVSSQVLHRASSGTELAATRYSDEAGQSGLHRFWQFWKDVDRASVCAMLETLRKLELIDGSDASSRLDRLVAEGRVLSQYRRLLVHWLAALTDWGHLVAHGGSYTVSAGIISPADDVERQLLAMEQAYGADESLAGFVEHVASSLRNHLLLLSGDTGPLTLLFPEGSSRVVESLYEKNSIVRHHNGVLSAMVRALVEAWKGDSSLRVLDVGAGMGGTSTAILPHFPAARTEYSYTDVSHYFFGAAKEKFKAYPFIRYSVYDINKEPKDQGYELGGYDLIIASNVLHNALDINASLNRLRTLLRPGGYLLLVDGTQSTPWMWAVVGFLEAAQSKGSRTGSDQWAFGLDEWSRMLSRSGFEDLQIFPAEGDRLSELLAAMPQHVIAARTPASARHFRQDELAAFLRDRLPDYMIPQRFVLLDKLPLTSNGKIDSAALPAEAVFTSIEARRVVSPASQMEEQVLNIWKDVLGVDRLSVTDNFFEVGGDSLLLTEVMRRINRTRQSPLTIAELFSYPTVQSLAEYIGPATGARGDITTQREPQQRTQRTTNDIAIVGMAGRFPDADNVDEFWRNVAAGKCAVRRFTDEELLRAGATTEELSNPSYVKAGLVLNRMDMFDAPFFGFTPRDAEIMDPQQRLLMESAVEALDSAGYPNEKYAGRIGVFVGKGTSIYLLEHLLPRTDLIQQWGMMPILNVNEKDHAATLVSYKLNLTGPSVNVNTTCSTSLVAVHLACESLLNGECELALAGGVSIVSLRESGYWHRHGDITSADGVCRAFSDDANGTLFGSGVGLVALKPLSSALRDGDTIHGLIKATAINNDGAQKVSYTAPSLHGQVEVLEKAQARAGVNPDTIQLIEAHGTGTELGDPIEFGALRRVFGGPRLDGSRCSLGSVKTNIGHLDAAAGVAGLIKTVQALKHKKIPPTLHVKVATRKVDFADSPFELPTALKDWPSGVEPRRAGVSSLGVGGTNAHVILEEAPVIEPRIISQTPQILPVSAKSPESLRKMIRALADEFGKRPELSLEDVAFTLQVGRNGYSHRSYIVCDGLRDAQTQFAVSERVIEKQNQGRTAEVVFLLPGQGALQKDATWELYEQEPRFRSALDECADLIQQYTGEDLRDWLYTKWQSDMSGAEAVKIEQTAVTQPLLFSVEYALARFWDSLGVRPTAMLGHSLGEYVAACIAGVFSLPEALSLMVVRGRLLQSLPPGQMLAVSCREAQLRQLLDGSACSVAVVNSLSQCVASGPSAEIAALKARLSSAGVTSSILRTSHAFHSQMVEPILQTFENCVAEVERHPPRIPFISNVSGQWITDEEATSPAYWRRHLRETVRFGDGLQQVLDLKNCFLLEVGPGRILTTLANQRDRSVPAVATLSRDRDSHSERRSLLDAVGQLWLHGAEIEWMPLHEDRQPRRVVLPAYMFDRKRYWIDRKVRLFSAYPALVEDREPAKVDVRDVVECVDVAGNHNDGALETEFVGPQGEVAVRLREIWKSYLGIENIGIRDNFFELGGDSLLAGRVHAQIRQEFNVQLPLARMFELATIRHISLYIAITRDPGVIDNLGEQDLDDALAIMESRPVEMRSDVSKSVTTDEKEN